MKTSSFKSFWIPVAGVILSAIALTVVFWSGLWSGGTLIGGDLYSYYIPQKTFLSERLQAGELPMWNSLIGHGFPLIAESQTGICYPIELVLYRFFSINTAYNTIQIMHYVLAFSLTCAYCRRIQIGWWGSFFAGLVYTYGWFPSRICLEWAIIGGAWLPLAFWAVESYLQRREWKYLFALVVAFTCQILPGHFCIGFITQLAVVVYVGCRLWQLRQPSAVAMSLPSTVLKGSRRGVIVGIIVAFASTYAISAVQVLPTWELKHLSQRSEVGKKHDPRVGHLPVWYISQVVQPWKWYLDSQIDLNSLLEPGSAVTNKVEAHLYFGMIPTALLIFGLASMNVFRQHRLSWIWLLIGLMALVYATGHLIPLVGRLPGFSFFIGPGRFGIATTFAVAVMVGVMIDWLHVRMPPHMARIVLGLALLITTAELFVVSRLVTYSTAVSYSLIDYVQESPIKEILGDRPFNHRVFGPGPNLPTILGVPYTPVYLGIGPVEYYDAKWTFPDPFDPALPPTPQQVEWLRRAGVTHILSMQPLQSSQWPCRLLFSGLDPFLNQAWGTIEPLYFYELTGGRGRVSWVYDVGDSQAEITEYSANRVVIRTKSAQSGDLILTDLDYPGWEVTIDDEPAPKKKIDDMFRGVTVPLGEHEVVWRFRPPSVAWGLAISLISAMVWAIAGHRRYHGGWLPKKQNRVGEGE
ncbi:MAG: YfhO family protein [Planctomycetaceae bacterium]